jgi:hypothetical protein
LPIPGNRSSPRADDERAASALPDSAPRELTTDHRHALIGVLAVGVLLRIVQFLQRPSLALDETRLALNIAARTVPQLMRPLDTTRARRCSFSGWSAAWYASSA